MAALTSKKITFPSKNAAGDAHGVLIGDASTSKRGLIVIHEWWGMNEQIQKEGHEIATDGKLTVLVADMYRGKVNIMVNFSHNQNLFININGKTIFFRNLINI